MPPHQENRSYPPVALVTGGARGQGAAHVRTLAESGYSVYACDVLDSAGRDCVRGMQSEGLDVAYQHLDVTSEEDWGQCMELINQAHGCLSTLINNAGVMHVTPVHEESLDAWNQLISINLTGAMLGARAAIPLLEASSRGSIINISSIFGAGGALGYSAYAASKAGLLGFTKCVALELAPRGIRVNAVCPGGVSSPMNALEPSGGVVSETPLGRRAEPTEISHVIEFLASAKASFMTGTEVFVDGGYMAH
ncbi:SDR family NAD(P)-dependent oxidoreductase [Curtobacterium sp. S6]|uniref:SDR family NAD(P)-dependent oxidoreductase n=1 Tax=Curtobacterium sp. S6 TaxID=1479623 RepID=UPI000691FC0B|nr:SDR family NAD(P)-dependent oxidoreductase [Curtobacterium sp. S6]